MASDTVAQVKEKISIVEVVSPYVKLARAGKYMRGLSPFNKEKTPSFYVNDQKQAWFDFSSQKNGSIFDFVMMTEGVTFPEAVERLARTGLGDVKLLRGTNPREYRLRVGGCPSRHRERAEIRLLRPEARLPQARRSRYPARTHQVPE